MTVELENQTAHPTVENVLGLPVDAGTMFSNHKNIYKPAIEKRQRNLLKKVSFIKPFLDEDEEILLVTPGHSPVSLIEQLLFGWLAEVRSCLWEENDSSDKAFDVKFDLGGEMPSFAIL